MATARMHGVCTLISLASFTRWLRQAWSYIALFAVIVFPLLWIAISIAIRSNLFSFSGAMPSDEQLKIFMTFIGGGLATAATVMASLLTWQHNKYAEQRLQLETVVKGLESLPRGEPRVAGAIATMVLLGHQAVAMRILTPAWQNDKVDSATATWLIGQVLCDDKRDGNAILEAASTLSANASKLTDKDKKGYISAPGSCFTEWHKDLPERPKLVLLGAIAETLLSRQKDWWMNDQIPMTWPAAILADAMVRDPDASVKAYASILLNAVLDCFPTLKFGRNMQNRLGADLRERAKKNAEAATKSDNMAMSLMLADKIRVWGGLNQPTPPTGPAGEHVIAA